VKKLLAILIAGLSLAACDRISSGNIGVKVNNYGSSAGVQAKPLGVGTYWFQFGSDIYSYPTYTNRYSWQKSEERDESITFQDVNGLIVSADVNVAYRADPNKAPILFQTYRGEMDTIVSGPVRDRVKAAIVSVASTMSVEDIYGKRKAALIQQAQRKVAAYFAPRGLIIEQLDWAGPIRIPEAITERINARAQTEQAAIAAKARVLTAEAEGQAQVAEAKAAADAQIEKARGQAEATRLRNAVVAQNPGYQSEYMRKWDGKLPNTVYCNSDTPCVTIPQ
jgi:regulator of protease activity HflC (stomatin/prohibitin superfamily)